MDQPCDSAILADYERRGRRADRLAIAGYIVGGAAILTGVTLYVLGRKDRRASTLSRQPTPGGALATTGWSF